MCFLFAAALVGVCCHLNALLNIIFRLSRYFALFSFQHQSVYGIFEKWTISMCKLSRFEFFRHGKYAVLLTFDCAVFFISAALFIICTHYLFCWQFSTDFILRAFSSVYFSFAFETNNHFKYALNVGLHIHLFYCCVFMSVSLVLHTIWMRVGSCK